MCDLKVVVRTNYDDRTRLSDEDDYNHDSEAQYTQKEILSGRGRFLSVDNVEDVKIDFGLKPVAGSFEKSEKTGNHIYKLLNMNENDGDCEISVSAIPEHKEDRYKASDSTFEVSSSSAESKYGVPSSQSEFGSSSMIQNSGYDQKNANMLTERQLEIEQEDILVSDPYDMSKSTNKGSASSCGTMSSVEAPPFYPTKSTAFLNSKIDPSEQQSFYN